MLKKVLISVFALMITVLGSPVHAQEYTGHDNVPRFRGMNADLTVLSSNYSALATLGVNVVRYQLYFPSSGWGTTLGTAFSGNGDGDSSSTDLSNYQAWFNWEVTNSSSDLNAMITYCSAHSIRVLIDMHQPPGGNTSDGTFRIFMFNDDYQDFLTDWKLVAQTYTGNSAVWGYDLCNEPDDQPTTEVDSPSNPDYNNIPASAILQNWNTADLAASQTIRTYDYAGGTDPSHALIVESEEGGPNQFTNLTPLPSSVYGVEYSFHTYGDNTFTMQDANAGYVVWPDPTPDNSYNGGSSYDFQRRDITALYGYIQGARAFQLANHCRIFVGEFGCFRWAPGSAEELNEQINMFESYGWDWTFQAFRSSFWNGFDAEVGPSLPTSTNQSGMPYLAKTDEKTALTGWLANNNTTLGNFDFTSNPIGTGSSAYTYGPSASPWNILTAAGYAGNGSAFSNPSSVPGSECAFLQSTNWGSGNVTGVISQSYQWTPYTQYVVSFEAANRPSCPLQTVNVYIGGTVTSGVLSGGTLVGTITPLTTSFDTYSTPPFTVGQGSIPTTQLLTFTGTLASDDQTAFLDSIAVSQLPPSSLPLGTTWLSGSNINDGSGSSGGAQYTAVAAEDGNVNTYYNSTLATGGWTGIDLGAGKTATLTHVYFYPRSDNVPAGDYASNMQGGVFQGSNNETTWTTLATVNNSDGDYGQLMGARGGCWCVLPVTGASPYRYFRYMGPANSYCNVAEIRFYGNETGYVNDGTSSTSANPPQAAFDGNYFTDFESSLSSGGWTGVDLGSGNQAVVNQVSFYPDSSPSKMVGGLFQGSNNNSTWTNLVPAIASTPTASQWTTLLPSSTTPAYRYLRYYNSGTGNSGVAEIQFYGDQAHVLTGTNINDAWGTTWGNPPANAYDGNTTTCYDSNLGSGGWTGVDQGAANPGVVTSISFYPCSSWGGGPAQMVGGEFQGSNDEATWTNLAPQITSAPTISTWTTLQVTNTTAYRYLRYYDNGSGSNYCNVAEVQFNGY